MINRNYKFEKRQKDLAKSKKKEEKLQRKLSKSQPGADEGATVADSDGALSADAAEQTAE